MPRITKKEKQLKLKALRVSLILLKRKSEIINFITVREKANKIGYPKYFSTKISKASIEQSLDSHFVKIRDQIIDIKSEKKKIKKIATTSSKIKINKLEKIIQNLTFNIASLLENEMELKELLELKNKTIEKMRIEINSYRNQIK